MCVCVQVARGLDENVFVFSFYPAQSIAVKKPRAYNQRGKPLSVDIPRTSQNRSPCTRNWTRKHGVTGLYTQRSPVAETPRTRRRRCERVMFVETEVGFHECRTHCNQLDVYEMNYNESHARARAHIRTHIHALQGMRKFSRTSSFAEIVKTHSYYVGHFKLFLEGPKNPLYLS